MNEHMAINEVLFMQIRLFRQFRERYAKSPKTANDLWDRFGIWSYIEDCYDIFHLMGDESILDDIADLMKLKGAVI